MYNGGNPRNGSRILVVRLGAMGDIIHTLPAVASLKHSFPGSRLTWVVESRWAPLLEGNPFVDRLVCLERTGAAALWRAWRELRAEECDFAVDFQGLIKSAVAAAMARPERIFGFHQSLAREPLAALFYSHKVVARTAHKVDQNLELAAAAGASTVLRTFPIPAGRAEGTLPMGPFVLASPLTGWGAKQWPLEYYAQLGARLRSEAGMPLVLNAPPQEHADLIGVLDTMPHLSSIEGLIDATRRATAVVGLDSGPLHLAAALGKPGVAIYGPTAPPRNGPYGDTFTVLRSPQAVTSYKRRRAIDTSMRDISPDAVFEALMVRLSQRTRPADCLA